MSKKEEFLDFCVGTVTVITSDSLVLTGRIIEDERKNDKNDKNDNQPMKVKIESEEELITLLLTAAVLKIPGNATAPGPVQTFYAIGDTIRISESQIVTVGPSHV